MSSDDEPLAKRAAKRPREDEAPADPMVVDSAPSGAAVPGVDGDDSDDMPLVKRPKVVAALAVKAEPVSPARGEKRAREEKVKKNASSDDEPLAKRVKKEEPKADSKPVKKPAAVPIKKEATTPVKPKPKVESAAAKPDSSDSDAPLAKRTAAKKEKPKKKKSSSSSSSESSDDVPLSKRTAVKKEPKKEKKAPSTPRKKKGDPGDKEEKKPRKKKEEEPVRKWWLDPPLPKGVKWRTLLNNGVCFAPPYQPHGVKMLYDGKPVDLTPEEEEPATWFAAMLEHEYTSKPKFIENFFEDWSEILNKGKKKAERHIIRHFEKCDFRPIHEYVVRKAEEKKGRSKEVKAKEKEEKDALKAKYGYAVFDGHKEPLGNFVVEPPGLFRGRGAHPKMGRIKRRIMPEDVTLNMDVNAPIPDCPIEDHHWDEKKIVHNQKASWVAFWKENINGNCKYVQPGAASSIKGRSDMKKFEIARQLVHHIDKIREDYMHNLGSKDTLTYQTAAAMYIIDKLALRVGGEKGEDEADTVGCCSLRVEHIKLGEDNTVEFDFLGKDSMRYHNTVTVLPEVYRVLKKCVGDKDHDDEVFEKLTPTILNSHLKTLMPNLSAKVFRTYNASITLEQELAKSPKHMSEAEKRAFYNNANRQVSILCNHQRAIPKNHEKAMEGLRDKIRVNEEQTEELRKELKKDKGNEGLKKRVKKLEERLVKLKSDLQIKDDNKEVALGTAKINYMDPRITTAWCKRVDFPLQKIFAATLMKKFPWAFDVEPDWGFTPEKQDLGDSSDEQEDEDEDEEGGGDDDD